MAFPSTPSQPPLDRDVEARPSPVMDSAKIGRWLYTAGPLLALLFTGLNIADEETVTTTLDLVVGAIAAIAAVVNFIAPVIRARRVRALVTPTSDPRDDSGRLLRPIDVETL